MDRVFVKRAARDFEQLRREAHNVCVIGSRESLADIMEANHQMAFFLPIQFTKRDKRQKSTTSGNGGGHVGETVTKRGHHDQSC